MATESLKPVLSLEEVKENGGVVLNAHNINDEVQACDSDIIAQLWTINSNGEVAPAPNLPKLPAYSYNGNANGPLGMTHHEWFNLANAHLHTQRAKNPQFNKAELYDKIAEVNGIEKPKYTTDALSMAVSRFTGVPNNITEDDSDFSPAVLLPEAAAVMAFEVRVRELRKRKTAEQIADLQNIAYSGLVKLIQS